MASLYYSTQSVPMDSWKNGVEFSLSGSTIPAGSIINSITVNFSVLVNSSSYSESFLAVLTGCNIIGGGVTLVSQSGSVSNPLASKTDTEPISFSYIASINKTISSDLSSLNIKLTGQAPDIRPSTYLSNFADVTINYTPAYATAPTSVGQSGYLNNYPFAGQLADGTGGEGGNLLIEGEKLSSGSFDYSAPSNYGISGSYYLVYSTDRYGEGNFTTIGYFSNSSGSFIPKNANIIANQEYYYYILAYSSVHKGYIKSYPDNHIFANDNTEPIINFIDFNPKYATTKGTEININIDATDADNNQLNYSISGINISNSFNTNNFSLILYPGTYTIKVSDGMGGEVQNNITINSIDTFSINVNEKSIINNIDTTVLEEGLVKKIDRLEPIGLLGSSSLNNLIFTLDYSYGESSTDLTLGSGNLGTESYFENIDIGELEPEIAENGLWYQFTISGSYSYNGINQTVTATYGPFKYPKEFKNASYTLYNGNFGVNFRDEIDRNIFNNIAYLRLKYPDNGTEEYSKINKVNIYISSSETETVETPYTLVKEFNTTNLSSDEIEININNIVPYNYYFNIYLELIALTGQTTNLVIDKINNSVLQRTYLPYFTNNIITSNLTKTIAVKNLENTELILTVPTVYSINDPNGSNEYSLMELLENIIFKVTIDNLIYEGSIALADCGFWCDDNTFNVSISPDNLITMLAEIGVNTTANVSYKSEIVFIATDYFNNRIEQNFLINSTDVKNSENIIFSLGVKPVLNNSSGNYSLKVKIPYSEEINYNITTSNNQYKNMINPNDILYITFPAATDENGNDMGTTNNHGDIISYKLKIQEKNNESFIIDEKDYTHLLTIPVNDSKLIYNNGLYTYEYNMPEREYSSFAKLAVCACDSTELDSNYYFYEPTLVLSRVSNAHASINSYKKNKTDNSSPNYNLTLKIDDIGGTLFKNNAFTYADYSNLERNITGSINDSRDIKFSLYYHTDGKTDFKLYENVLTYNINNETTTYTSYNSAISYNDILNASINFLNLDFSETEINPDNKNYFKFIIEVQIGFDTSGNKVYSNAETAVFTIFPTTPVMYFGKNAAGINTQELDNNKVLRIATVEQEKNLFQIDSFDEQSAIIFDLVSKLIEGITISDED